MKRFLSLAFLVLTALAIAPAARAGTDASCDNVVVSGPCTWISTAADTKISMTVSAVNLSTGARDEAATSESEIVLEFKECESCPPIRYPKDGDAPLINVGGGGEGNPARSFRLPPKTWAVRWNVLVLTNGRIRGVVSHDR